MYIGFQWSEWGFELYIGEWNHAIRVKFTNEMQSVFAVNVLLYSPFHGNSSHEFSINQSSRWELFENQVRLNTMCHDTLFFTIKPSGYYVLLSSFVVYTVQHCSDNETRVLTFTIRFFTYETAKDCVRGVLHSRVYLRLYLVHYKPCVYTFIVIQVIKTTIFFCVIHFDLKKQITLTFTRSYVYAMRIHFNAMESVKNNKRQINKKN